MVGTKVLIVGMNPSNKPTLGRGKSLTFKRLEKWMDYCGVKHFSFVNTFDSPGDNLKISDVDLDRMCTLTQGYDKILSLGGFASKVLDKIGVNHFTLPHPSPRNRKFNDPFYEANVVSDCKMYIACVANLN